MGIQAGIFNSSVRPTEDPIAQYMKLSELRNVGLQRQREQQQLQEGQMRLSELGRQQSDQKALRDSYAKAASVGRTAQVNNGTMNLGGVDVSTGTSTVKGPGMDDNVLLSEVHKRAPHLVPQLQEHMAATQAAAQKAALEQQKLGAEMGKITAEAQLVKWNVAGKQIERTAALLANAKDPASYAAAVQQAKTEGIPENFPPEFDPQWVAAHVNGAVGVLDQVKNKQKDLELKIQQQNADTSAGRAKEDKRHNLATEAQAAETQDNKAISAVQNRAALSDNVEENLKTIEDIMKRRPELFGKWSGNMSNLALSVGSNDPDKLAYNQAVENLSRANAGMHNMRSKYAIEGDVKNLNFKNGVEGLKGTVASIRKSAEQFKNEAGTAQPSGGGTPSPKSHTFSLSAWRQANPQGDVNAAKKAAIAAGYEVIQ